MNKNPLYEMVPLLLAWYQKNQRILPWRQTKDPYSIWVSEIMLQQTRVDTVIPYYNQFLTSLPTVKELKEISEDSLLKLWEGLGYYNRVKNMQKAAKFIIEEKQGIFPSTFEEIKNLPGIGDYTAGAIGSIAFELPISAVDGNVVRVISRIMASDLSKKEIENLLMEVYPKEAGDFTQSLMELGALICTPQDTYKCEKCPLKSLCKANLLNLQSDFPKKVLATVQKVEKKTVFLLLKEGNICIEKRAAKGLLGSLWQFPNAEGHLTKEQAVSYLKSQNIEVKQMIEGKNKKHVFSHIKWQMISYIIQCGSCPKELLFKTKDEIKQYCSLPTAFKSFLE